MDTTVVPPPGTPEPVPPQPDEAAAGRPWRPMSLTGTRTGYVVVLRPRVRVPGRDDSLYWCGHADWYSFVNWLTYHDPSTDADVPARVAVYRTRVDAVAAWDAFRTDRGRRELPPPVGLAEVVPLARITHRAGPRGPSIGDETAPARGERDV